MCTSKHVLSGVQLHYSFEVESLTLTVTYRTEMLYPAQEPKSLDGVLRVLYSAGILEKDTM